MEKMSVIVESEMRQPQRMSIEAETGTDNDGGGGDNDGDYANYDSDNGADDNGGAYDNGGADDNGSAHDNGGDYADNESLRNTDTHEGDHLNIISPTNEVRRSLDFFVIDDQLRGFS